MVVQEVPALRYRKLPKSELTLSEIGLGCYSLTGAYGRKDGEAFARVLRRAFELGVTFFDTADHYTGASEVLGQAVKGFRDKVVIATKVGVTEDGGRDLSPAHVKASCEDSLRRLGTDHVDLFQVHFDDPRTPVAETAGAMEELRAAGKIREYGVGHLPPERVAEWLATTGAVSVMMELSAATRASRRGLLPLCTRHGAGALAFSVTARGLLTGRIRPGHVFEEGDIRRIDALFQEGSFESGLRVAAKLGEIGAKHGKTPAQAAIAWVLAQPGVVSALTGPSSLGHLEENLGASGFALGPDELAELEALFSREDESLAAFRRGRMEAVLSGPLDPDPNAAWKDLVFVMEAAAEFGLIGEARLLEIARPLLGARRKGAQAADLADVQRLLRESLKA